ncbi:MAG: iron-containing alcohol dehydrogenase, partial [Deltaproteobacteria bacterium]|nr:iron-containing alcohol dehydrogenase [Deltaproteobacteria bacterium]
RYVLEYNRSAIEDRMARLAAYLGFENPSFTTIMNWVLELKERFNIPVGLVGLGLDDSKADEIAEKAAVDPTAPTNAIPLTVADMKTIFMNALK